MKIFTRILAPTISGLALIGGMSLGAQADTPPVSNGAPVADGDLTLTATGPWSYQQGLAMEVNVCLASGATAAHRVAAADFSVSTSSGVVPAQALQPSAGSFPTQAQVKPGACVHGYVLVPSVKPAAVSAIDYNGHSWKPATGHPTAQLGEIATSDHGMFVHVSNLHRGDFGLWVADLTLSSQTPVHVSSQMITTVAGGRATGIFNYEGDALPGSIPLEADLGAVKSLSGQFSFASDSRPTAIIVDGVTFSIAPAKAAPTTTATPGKIAVTKSGMFVKVSNVHRGDSGLWVADLAVTAQSATHFSYQLISFTAGGVARPIFNYEGDALPGSIPLEADLAAGKSLSGQISFASDSRPTAITIDGVTFTIAPNNAGATTSSNDKPAASSPGLPKTGN